MHSLFTILHPSSYKNYIEWVDNIEGIFHFSWHKETKLFCCLHFVTSTNIENMGNRLALQYQINETFYVWLTWTTMNSERLRSCSFQFSWWNNIWNNDTDRDVSTSTTIRLEPWTMIYANVFNFCHFISFHLQIMLEIHRLHENLLL